MLRERKRLHQGTAAKKQLLTWSVCSSRGSVQVPGSLCDRGGQGAVCATTVVSVGLKGKGYGVGLGEFEGWPTIHNSVTLDSLFDFPCVSVSLKLRAQNGDNDLSGRIYMTL